jgi:hypothetical protein
MIKCIRIFNLEPNVLLLDVLILVRLFQGRKRWNIFIRTV